MFTGDRSGDFLFAALHRKGLASRPDSIRRDDGLRLRGVYLTAPCRCAPPANQPLPEELSRCAPFLDRELALLHEARVFLALGAIGWRALAAGRFAGRPRPAFAHGASVPVPGGRHLLASYHVSQQNTQTGRLTAAMFDRILDEAARLASLRES